MAERHVARFARRDGHGEADELGDHRIDRRRLGVESDAAGRVRLHDPGFEVLARDDRFVLRAVERRLGRRGSLGGAGSRRLRNDRLALRLFDSGRRATLGRHRGADGNLDRRRRLGAQALGNATRQGIELHDAQEAEQLRRIGIAHAQRFGRDHVRHVVLEAHELARHTRLVGELDQLLAPLRLLDLAGAGQQRIEIAVLLDQLRRRLDADARHAGDVVGRIAGQRLHVDDLFGRHAELLDHLVAADLLALHGVEHDDAGPHELHQVLVGGDDGHVAAGIDDLARVAGDEVVRLEAVLLDAGDVERLHGVADERELRDELIRRRRTVRLVVLVDLLAEGLLRRVEDDGEMGRCLGGLRLAQELPQHGAEPVHGTDRQPVRRPRQRRQRVEGAEDVARAVDEVDVAALGDGRRLARGHGRRRGLLGFAFRFAHGGFMLSGCGAGL